MRQWFKGQAPRVTLSPPSPQGPEPGSLITHSRILYQPHLTPKLLTAGCPGTSISCMHTECIRTAVQMDFGQAASEVTSTLMVGVHSKLSSKRPQYHTAQKPGTIQPTPGNPDRGQYLPEDTAN